ncbi:polyprenyl diphosphate synthase [Magnetofaba australis]|uniref:Isoprenyl transferase n=1 Tax=Magnetofaba australis IT-1 TaxID=1434232 RepID=A0A1Y2K6J7_9PROT|nr:polyprenyl diphosphate synthase [Magnetofaba australis]OSM05160.1 putative undecaprenyl pyrophosphate synthetase [Magnetofaba australis IT-1]
MSKSTPPLPENLPRHVAIVMDGNRRWAKKRFLPKLEGHRQGVKAVRRTIEACLEFKIPTLTLYTFSAENWNRPEEEVSALMNLLALHLKREVDELVKEGVRFRALGRLHELPPKIRDLVRDLEQKTTHNTDLNFNIALNYGGRQELIDAARSIAQDVANGDLSLDAIDDAQISNRLTTVGQPDPDLMIRTGGEQRVSNFLLWQVAYTELVFLPIFWPEFDRKYFLSALEEFSRRERRFGAAS